MPVRGQERRVELLQAGLGDGQVRVRRPRLLDQRLRRGRPRRPRARRAQRRRDPAHAGAGVEDARADAAPARRRAGPRPRRPRRRRPARRSGRRTRARCRSAPPSGSAAARCSRRRPYDRVGTRGHTAGMRFETRPLTPETWGDLEELFGLPGGSIVRGCWCMYYRKTGPGLGERRSRGDEQGAALLAGRRGRRPGAGRLRRRGAGRLGEPGSARGVPQAPALLGHEAGRRRRGLVAGVLLRRQAVARASVSSTGCSPRPSTMPATTVCGSSSPTPSTRRNAATTTSCSSARAASTRRPASARSYAAPRRGW